MDLIKKVDAKHPIEFTVPAFGAGSFYIQEDVRENFYSHYHRHKEYQISYILKGSGSVVIGNLIQPFFENEIFIIKANDPHVFINDDGSRDGIHVIHIFIAFEKLRIFFDMQELHTTRDLFTKLETSKKLTANFSKEISAKFLALQKIEGLSKLMCLLEIFEFLISKENEMKSLYSGLRDANFNDKVGVRINEILRYSLENFNKEISIEEIAQLIHMTPSAFCKYFKKHTMKTYITFLNEIRIERACQMLINRSTDNISEVAYQCGFNTVVHFNRVFKNILQSSPSQFMHNHAANWA